MTIDIHSTLDTIIKQINPGDERGAKTHSGQSRPHEIAVYSFKSLFLIQQKNSNWGVKGSTVVNISWRRATFLPI